MGEPLSVVEVVVRILVALGPAVLIGLEREVAAQPAGLRTHALLALGAALFTIGGLQVAAGSPARVAAQVASGVGFLGAGAILQERFQVRGLTTAASLWVTAAIGVAAGAGAYVAVAITTGITLILLTAMRWIEGEFFPRRRGQALTVNLTPEANIGQAFQEIRSVTGPMDLRQVEPAPDGGQKLVGHVRLPGRADLPAAVDELRSLPGVTGVSLSR